MEAKRNSRLNKKFDFAINWLDSNVSNNYCPRYSLIHGDAHFGNALLTNSKITLVDWEAANIGDPAFDVASAYVTTKFFNNSKAPDSSECIAERFLSEYLQEYDGDLRSKLKFYEVVCILAYAILYSSGLSSPIKAYNYHRRKVMQSIPFLKLPLILFAFPFFRWSFMARIVKVEAEIDWLNYFEKFMQSFF